MPNRNHPSLLIPSMSISLCCALGVLVLAPPTAQAQEESITDSLSVTNLTMGFRGVGRVGNWLPVSLLAHGALPATNVTLVITASDPKGNQCESVVTTGRCDAAGVLKLSGVFITGRQDGIIRLRLDDSEHRTLWRHSVICRAEPAKQREATENLQNDSASPVLSEMTLLQHHSLTLLTAGSPVGLPELSRRLTDGDATRGALTLLTVNSPEQIPDSRRALESVDTILLVTDYGLSELQTLAIQDWIATGGHLLVSCGENLPRLLESPVGSWLQPEFGIQPELIRSQDLSAIQNFVAGASQLQTNRQNVAIVRMASEHARVVVNSINGPLISRISAGAGVVTMVAVDLNLKPLNRWLSLSQMYEMLLFERLLDTSGEQVSRGGRISSTGVNDLATQLASISDAIPSSERWSTWQAMLLMLVYLMMIGPLDYFLVVRLLQRPGLTWVTFPALVAVACGLTFWWSSSHRADVTVRDVHLLDVGQIGRRQTVRARSWSSLSTSDSRYGSVAAKPLLIQSNLPLTSSAVTLVWHGRAEDVFGGLYRPGGAGLGRQTSRRTEIGDSGFSSVPLVPDGSQAFLAESFLDARNTPVFESQLKMPASGLLDGSFVHHLPVAIRDWVIVFGNRVYRPSQKADEKFLRIEPGESWSRHSGGVRVSEIRDFLRGVRIISQTAKKGQVSQNPPTQIQSTYNTAGTNPLDILLMISLYNTAGGEVYVRLQDDYLKHDEVSDAIQLNTAMMIGVADLPLTQLRLDNQPLDPVETQTVIRFFLPVERSMAADDVREADPGSDEKQHEVPAN